MRSLLAVAAAFLAAALVRAQDPDAITPLVPDPDVITPLVSDPDVITPLVTPTAADASRTTATLCSSARAIVTPNALGVVIDPYNPPEGWDCYLVYQQGGGSWTIPIGANGTSSDSHDNKIVTIVVPVVVAVAVALGLLGIGVFAIRRRAQRAHKAAATRPWFKRQGWVTGSTPNVAEISKPQPAMVQTNIV
ncbi:hypothetical protein AURDEDRAFT_114137 [Auricularia subglabra TFB-10046 SS5]|nr:hypothetical protein AURDEDRAFT_114137 [Auricularia subglabra TFB-10046 SS5]